MAEIHIQMGTTDGFRYIGVQPPITDEQRDMLRQAEYVDGEIPTHFTTIAPDIGEPYSETGFATELYIAAGSADRVAAEKAEKLARVLRSGGDTVIIDEGTHTIGKGYDLFGGKARRLG